MMRRDHMHRQTSGRPRDRIAAVLRREAAAERPTFSDRFHGRLLRRLESGVPRDPLGGAVAAAPVPPTGRRLNAVPVLSTFAAVALVSLVLLRVGPDRSPPTGQPADLTASMAMNEPPGIESLPMFDELDAGLQAGVATLAMSLFEPPDWRSLAEFDPAGIVGADAEP